MVFYLITAPHVWCKTEIERACDRSSSEAAIMLYLAFKHYNPEAKVTLLLSDDFRLDYDDNRTPKKIPSSFQRKFLRILRENKDIIHLDIHSYPSNYSWGKQGKIPDIVTLSFPYDNISTPPFAYNLTASNMNWLILNSYRSKNVILSHLIEFRDNSPNFMQNIQNIALFYS